jgi:hypothetical protein
MAGCARNAPLPRSVRSDHRQGRGRGGQKVSRRPSGKSRLCEMTEHITINNSDGHDPPLQFMVVNRFGLFVDLSKVYGQLFDPTVLEITWGELTMDGRTFGRVKLKNGTGRTFWDSELMDRRPKSRSGRQCRRSHRGSFRLIPGWAARRHHRRHHRRGLRQAVLGAAFALRLLDRRKIPSALPEHAQRGR